MHDRFLQGIHFGICFSRLPILGIRFGTHPLTNLLGAFFGGPRWSQNGSFDLGITLLSQPNIGHQLKAVRSPTIFSGELLCLRFEVHLYGLPSVSQELPSSFWTQICRSTSQAGVRQEGYARTTTPGT